MFHAVLKSFRAYRIQGQHLLVGVSGGLDSMTLLFVLLSVSSILGLKISVVYVHHGSKDKKQRAFQDRALRLVRGFCQKNHLPFYSNGLTQRGGPKFYFHQDKHLFFDKGTLADAHLNMKNEAELRAYRYQIFLKYFKESQADFLALAHTAEDLLETQLLRLIRGTGSVGIKAMCFKRGRLLRPLIGLSRQQLRDYALKTQVKWCEDPTNRSTDFSLRNWIRHKWLPLLEKRQPGSLKAMARSLNLLAYSVKPNQIKMQQKAQSLIKEGVLKRDKLLALPLPARQGILAYYLKQQGLRNYSLGHVKEILKQLERKQKNFQFFLLGKTWTVSSRYLKPLT